MSKETKFTKGDWVVFMPIGYNDEYGIHNDTEDEIIIGMSTFIDNPHNHKTIHKVVIEGFSFDGDSDEEIANAHLIKTSPKLYAEIEGDIKLFESMAEEMGGDNGVILLELANVKRLLLAEARGEE